MSRMIRRYAVPFVTGRHQIGMVGQIVHVGIKPDDGENGHVWTLGPETEPDEMTLRDFTWFATGEPMSEPWQYHGSVILTTVPTLVLHLAEFNDE